MTHERAWDHVPYLFGICKLCFSGGPMTPYCHGSEQEPERVASMISRSRLCRLAGAMALALAVSAGASADVLTKTDGLVRHDFGVDTVDPTAVQAANRRTG